jgi:AbrB family looped-hinge helix DNA binding protein
MEASAKVTSKGQVTIPATVREALGIRRGTRLVFHVENDQISIREPDSGRQAVIATLPDFFDLAGSVAVPMDLRGASWPTIRRRAREGRAGRAR